MAAPLIAGGIGVAIGATQALLNAGKIKRANRDLKRLFSQRKAFVTPKEVFDNLNMAQFDAQSGFSADTMSYLTGQAGAGLSAGLDTASKLGADPNQLSTLIGNYYGDIFKVGAESDLVKMRKFDKLSNALALVAQNKEAEWASRDNLIKDQMQAAAQRLGAAQAGVQSGLNFALNSGALAAGYGMYNSPTPPPDQIPAGVDTSRYTVTTPAATPAPDLTVGNQRGNFKI